MVKECDNCDEYAYATRYKDSWLSFCRACGYWREDGKEGMFDDEKLNEMREKWPLRGVEYAPDDVDESLWK